MSEGEIWKDIAGYEGLYKVSNKGNVYSVERKDSMGRKWGGRTLKPMHDKNGYLTVALYENGLGKNKKIHRLVSEAFLPNPNNYPEVNHIDEVKDNNNVNNLEWCTREYNINHGTSIERSAQARSRKVRAVNVETGEVVKFNSTREAKRKGYTQEYVSSACRGVYKNDSGKLIGDGHTYRGYRWSYTEEGE